MNHQFQRFLTYSIFSLLTLTFASSAFSAAIYKFRDPKGVINYTNILPKGVTPQIVMVYCAACDPASKVDFSHVKLKITDFGPHIKAAIAKNPVDEALVRAIIQAESAYNPYALSKAGAQGLMQLMPGTAAQYGVSDSYDAQQNINGGVAYLRFLLNMFDGDVRLASAAYNAGENNVLKYAGVPPFAETQVYVQRVGQLYLRYRADIAARETNAALPVAIAAAPTAAPATPANPVAASVAPTNVIASVSAPGVSTPSVSAATTNPAVSAPAVAALTAKITPAAAVAPIVGANSFGAMVNALATSLTKPVARSLTSESIDTKVVAANADASSQGNK